jgi:hypothetical protein
VGGYLGRRNASVALSGRGSWCWVVSVWAVSCVYVWGGGWVDGSVWVVGCDLCVRGALGGTRPGAVWGAGLRLVDDGVNRLSRFCHAVVLGVWFWGGGWVAGFLGVGGLEGGCCGAGGGGWEFGRGGGGAQVAILGQVIGLSVGGPTIWAYLRVRASSTVCVCTRVCL